MLTRNSYLANAILGGTAGLLIAILMYVAMSWCSFTLISSSMTLEGSVGVCLPSPNQWVLSAGMGLGLSATLTALCLLLMITLNARFSIIPGTGTLYATMFLIAAGIVPWSTQRLTSPIIMLAAILICIHLLFSLHGRKNASQGIFIIFSILSWGSMIQYAFLLFMPIFMLGAIFAGIFRFREFIASILGIIAPYWIMIGGGIISPQDLSLPTLTNLFTGFAAPGLLFYLMAGQGFTALLTLLLTASNALAASTNGQQQRSYIAFVNLLGIAMVWYMLFDFTNMLAYSAVLALCMGLQTARYAAIPRHKFAYLPVLIAIPAYLAIFYLTISNC